METTYTEYQYERKKDISHVTVGYEQMPSRINQNEIK